MNNSKTFRKEELELMTTEQLGNLLRSEVVRDDYDEEVIRLLLDMLEDRESDLQVSEEIDIDDAWEEFQTQYVVPDKKKRDRHPKTVGRWFGRVAAVAAVVCLLVVAAPKAMGAPNLFELIGKWTADIFAFFTPGGAHVQQEYEYKTDHPGLQQVYDTVTELGVTERIVPSWLPDGHILEELEVKELPDKTRITAKVRNDGDTYISLIYDIYLNKTPSKFPKDENEAKIYNHSDVDHYVFQNYDRCNVVWAVDNIECSIAANIEEGVLYRVIQSIYTEE